MGNGVTIPGCVTFQGAIAEADFSPAARAELTL